MSLLPAAKLCPGGGLGPSVCKVKLNGGWQATCRSDCHEPFIKHSKTYCKVAAPMLDAKNYTEAHVHQCSTML